MTRLLSRLAHHTLSIRVAALALAAALTTVVAQPSSADFPFKATTGVDTDKYAYQNYMYIDPAQYPPSDIGGEAWKYSSTTACDLYGGSHVNCQPSFTANAQELFGVTGASVDKAWERTTGRPDVVIAVIDSGIMWNSATVMGDVSAKTWLNTGELPEPDWGTRDPAHPYDRNADGIVNIKDYCADLNDEFDCAGTGDSRVRGAAGVADTDFNANGLIDPEDLIFLFSDGVDDDGNGYRDDFVGWDAAEDDNDPFDEVQFGHGSGEARDSTAEANNGGEVGTCPNCMVMHVRYADSFIGDVNDWAEAVLYAADNGASVVQSAAGTLNNTRFVQEAINYLYRRGVAVIASAADESAGHHNAPTFLEHAIGFNAIGEPQDSTSQPRSYLQFRGCTNYGAYLTASVPANSCSSEATGRAAGMAGLIYAAARNGIATGAIADYGALDGSGGVPAGRGVSAEEVDQVIATTADDINFVTPSLYTSRTGFTFSTERYPATAGWDPFFGYGRVNADRMVRAVAQNKIPPEADITSPAWFQTIDPDTPTITVAGFAGSRRSAKYSYTVEWALWSWRDANAAPSYTSTGVTLAASGDQTSPVSGTLATISTSAIKSALTAANGTPGAYDGPAVDPVTGRGDQQNRQIPDKFGVIVRVRVTAKDGAGTPLTNIDGGPLVGVGTKEFDLHDDPGLAAGFPKDLAGDGASAPRLADLDDDGADELIVATGNGVVHAYKSSGGEAAGWPAYASTHGVHTAALAYTSGEITLPVRASILRAPAVGDIDRDGDLEVAVADLRGRLSVYRHDGTLMPGFPVQTDPHFSSIAREAREAGYYAAHPELVPGSYPGPLPLPNDPDIVPDLVNRRTTLNRTHWAFSASPVLANIDLADDDLEILAGAADRHLYAFKSDGTAVAGWPVMLRDPAKIGSYDSATHEVTNAAGVPALNGAKIMSAPAVGDIDGNGVPDVVAVVNEQYDACFSGTGCSDGLFNSDDAAGALLSASTSPSNQRVYAVHADGSLHAGAASGGPNPNAFLPGWPVKIASVTKELLPLVGNGPDGAPVIANVDGGADLEVGVFGTVGPAYILKSNGVSIYGRDAQNRDKTLNTVGLGAGRNTSESFALPALGGGIFTRALGGGTVAFAAPSAGMGKFFDLAYPDDQLLSDNLLSLWKLDGSRTQSTAFPREVNDLMFLGTPISADISNDGSEEILIGTSYSDFHAFSTNGTEPGLSTLSPTGWPKFTGGWMTSSAAVGDFDGDGLRDVAAAVREGRLYLWTTSAAACQPASWPEWGHDGWSTNNLETDAMRPARISDLTLEQTAGGDRLRWLAPGDDGSCGTADHYEVRYAASPITTDTWAAATLIASPTANPAGSAELFALPSLPPGTYFAVRAFDEAENGAAVSALPTTVLNTDGDSCSDAEEDGGTPALGGSRDKTDPWDFYDVTGDRAIDLTDTLLILSHFGHGPTQDALDDSLDRQIVNEATPWRTSASDDGIDLTDALNNLQSFGHDCSASP